MKNLIIFLSILFIYLSTSKIYGQEELLDINIKELSLNRLGMPDEDKEMVIKRCQNILQDYQKYSKFSSESFLFEFEQLFDTDFSVQLYNDLEYDAVTKNLNIGDYIRMAEESYVPTGGMNVTLDNIRLKSIRVTPENNYMVILDMEKNVEKKLQSNGEFKYSGSGFGNDIIVYIEIDPVEDDVDGAKIVKLTGSSSQTKVIEKKEKFKAEKEVLVSIGVIGGLGTISNSGAVVQPTYIGNTSLNSYGGYLNYTRSINDKLFANVRIQGEVLNISSSIENFDARNLNGFNSSTTIETIFLDPDNFNNPTFDDEFVSSNSLPTSYNDANEKLSLLNIQTAIGINYLIDDGFLISKSVIGLDFLVNYIQGSGDGVIIGESDGLIIPQKYNFPDQAELLANFNATNDLMNLPKEYTSDGSNNSTSDIKPKSNLSFGIGANYNKIFGLTKSVGIEVGLGVQYNITSLFSNVGSVDSNGKPFDGYVLDEKFSNRKHSLLEDHFSANKPLRGLIKVGLVFSL